MILAEPFKSTMVEDLMQWLLLKTIFSHYFKNLFIATEANRAELVVIPLLVKDTLDITVSIAVTFVTDSFGTTVAYIGTKP